MGKTTRLVPEDMAEAVNEIVREEQSVTGQLKQSGAASGGTTNAELRHATNHTRFYAFKLEAIQFAREATITGVYAATAGAALGGAIVGDPQYMCLCARKSRPQAGCEECRRRHGGFGRAQWARRRAWHAYPVQRIQSGFANAVKGKRRLRCSLGTPGSWWNRSRIYQGRHHRRESDRAAGPDWMHDHIGNLHRRRDRGRTWPGWCCRGISRGGSCSLRWFTNLAWRCSRKHV